ncbi:protein of unknown function [Candidatus Nitrotoga arctica]|uniref:Uncharacterized protein n=1 Tax=Candidatus Nitrotoga arctica TaxID=453162 RepID=A0ABN8ARU8_9PROT|nr:protein of unknown function [Candidatus Nitrotoga arctica]
MSLAIFLHGPISKNCYTVKLFWDTGALQCIFELAIPKLRTITMNVLNRYGPLLGRLLIAFIFVMSNFDKMTGFEGT